MVAKNEGASWLLGHTSSLKHLRRARGDPLRGATPPESDEPDWFELGVAVRHQFRSSPTLSRRRCFAARILVFAVPSGMCSWRATSAAVISKAPASRTDRTRIGERLIRADRTSARLSSIPFRSSGSQDPGVGPTQISEGSTGIARFIRTQSKAALRTIVFIHTSSEPRPASNMAPFLHARSRATCATSSAEPESPTIRYAIHHSRRQKRCTNCPAHSSSPAQKPSRRSSSDTLSCVIGASPFPLLSFPLVGIACWALRRSRKCWMQWS